MSKLREHIDVLAKKAADTEKAGDALHFSQSALNLANTLIGLKLNNADD